MTSTPKQLKEKNYTGTPRLVPRPTAASAARAARNATNRNLTTPPQKQSPIRATPSSSPIPKVKSPPSRNAQKTESKSDIKVNKSPANEPENNIIEVLVVESQQDVSYVVIDDTVTIDENINRTNSYAHLQEINEKETKHKDQEHHEHHEDQLELQNANAIDCQSRPQTPIPCGPRTPTQSRPQTPKSLPSSHPQTPRSRPTTPAHPKERPHPLSNPPTSASRPTTPRHPTRPTTPQISAIKPSSPEHVQGQEDIKSIYSVKQRQFNRMKMELDLKQQAIIELFDTLRSLHDRMHREGLSASGEGRLHELVVFNVGDWTTEEVSQLCREATKTTDEAAVELINTVVSIDHNALQDLDTKVLNLPARFADLCLKAFSARQELIDWLKELIENNSINDNTDEYTQRIGIYNAQGLQLCEALRELKSRADDVVANVTQLSRQACQERSALVAVGESLVREIAKLRQDIESRAVSPVVTEVREIRPETDNNKALEEVRNELEEERAAKTAAKDKLATAESQLRQMRIRINKMDRQLREAEASITSLTGTVKSLEDQSRQKEVQLEARARKLKESLKTGEVASGHLAQQRDALQNEIVDLKQQIEKLTTEHKSTIQELTNKLKETNACFEDHRKSFQKEVEIKESIEAALQDSVNTVEELRTKVTELENSIPNPDLPTEREMDLWAELQATKDTLRITEDEVTACKREKVRFLETLTKIAGSENKVAMQQKLAAELLSKEELMAKMQMQIREQMKTIKMNEQKVIQYEQYVRDLQAHHRTLPNNQDSPDDVNYQDLQQEILGLKMGMLEAVHRNEVLNDALLQKEQQLEQQDKTSRAQARVIKVREELINMLKNKETEQGRELTALQQDLEHRMKIVDEVNKQIASKADEIQELFGTLENKQQQIHRLEKIVLALEEQQRRAQAQRIRHEEKIAALEHELAAWGSTSQRKFIFF